MSQTTTLPRAALLCLELLGLLLLGTVGPVLGQNASPFKVEVTPASTSLPVLLTAAAKYPAFSAVPGLTGTINAVAVQADGKLLLAGQFSIATTISGSTVTRTNIARLNADGTLDTGFAAEGTFSSTTATIGTIAVQADGNILVGGSYTFTATSGSRSYSYLMRLTTTGALDPGFAPRGTSAATGLDGTIDGITVQTNGKILVGGNFTHYNNGTTNTIRTHIARLNQDGGLDGTYAQLGRGFDTGVGTMVVQADDKVLVAGAFHKYDDGSPNGITRNYFARLNTDGTLDTSFAPPNGGAGFVNTRLSPNDGTVEAFALQPDGKIVVGGRFTGYNDGTLQSRAGIARLNTDGSLDLSFATSGGGFNNTTANPSSNDYVLAVVVQPDNKILVGGAFTQYNNAAITPVTTLRNHVARLNADGTLDGFTPPSGSTLGIVTDIALQPNSKVVVGGVGTMTRLTDAGGPDATDTAVPNATYAWSNGSTGSTLTVVAGGTYSATATAAGLTATSNAMVVAGPVASFTVRVAPNGPFNICSGTTQVLTAAVQGTTQAATYTWWKVGTSTSVGPGSTYTVSSPGQYFATALVAGATAASATITVGTLATPTITTSVSGLPGAVIVLRGSNFQVITGVSFGSLPAAFVLNSSTLLTATVPAGATSGDITLITACTRVTIPSAFTVPSPGISSFAPSRGLPGTSVVLTGTGFVARATSLSFNGVSVSPTNITVISDTKLTAVVPTAAPTGPGKLAISNTSGSATSLTDFTVDVGTPTIINNTQTLLTAATPGAYQYGGTLIIKAPGNVTVRRNPNSTFDYILIHDLEVQAGATLNIVGDAKVICPGTFSLAAGATLNVGHPNGLNLAAPPLDGAVYLGASTPSAAFSPDASYGYIGTTTQITGNGLPRRVRNLNSTNPSSLTLSSPVAVAQVLTIGGAGNFYLNNQMLTLLSGAGGTALVHNQGAGVVVGTATVQRYIDPGINPTAGFRYYGSPVRGARAAVFGVPAFAYEQARSLAFVRQDTLPDISVGFVPTPLATSAFLEVGRGYRAAVAATDTVRFTGTLTTGNDTVNLLRSSRKAYSGWNLVSNPYPSPLNWNKVDPTDRPGLEAAIYVYESTGPGKGYFRSYVYKKLGTGDSLIAAGQAFFVRVHQNPGTQTSTGRLIFRNSQRVTEFDSQTQPIFNRTAVAAALEPRLDIEFERNGGCKPCRPTSTATAQATPANQVLSRVTVYTNKDAMAGFDPLLDADAGNLINLNQQTLGIRIGSSTRSSAATDTLALLAVQALPPINPARVTRVPLVLGATAPGIYTLGGTGQNLSDLLNNATAYLRDSSATTNNWIALPTATPYAFLLTATELLTKAKTVRFWLHFGPGPVVPLATAASAALQSATVYPNPAHEQLSVWIPAVVGATQVQATLLSTLGQVVQQQVATLPAAGTTLRLSVPGQASGMYLLRLQAGSSTVMRRIVLE